jgi:hypothetical protein
VRIGPRTHAVLAWIGVHRNLTARQCSGRGDPQGGQRGWVQQCCACAIHQDVLAVEGLGRIEGCDRRVHLGGATWLKFGGVFAKIMRSGGTSIVAVVPKRAHSGKITVHTRSGGTSMSAQRFVVMK